jgi:hypothetical protein
LASVAEVGASAMSVSAIAASRISMIAGGLGFAAAGVAALALLVPGLIEEGKQETRVGKFADALSDYLTQYEIDGVPQGDIWDIPYEEWPGEDSTIAS